MKNIDTRLKRATYGTVGLVAGFAAIMSYVHIRDLVFRFHYDALTAYLSPLSVDGLILGCSLLMIIASRSHLRASVAKFGMWLGIVATVAANVAYGLPHGVVEAIPGAWPAAAFIVLVEAVMQLAKRQRSKQDLSTPVKGKTTRKYTRKLKVSPPSGTSGEGSSAEVENPIKISKVYDGVPTAYRIATDLKCGHAKSVDLRQIMIDEGCDLDTAVKIRAERKREAGVRG